MCVIIVKPAGSDLPTKTELKRAYQQNPDGCGFVSMNHTFRSLDFESFYSALKKVRKSENCIIHFRWATQGSVCTRNCHPFYDSETRTYFAHNGVLPFHPDEDITDSEYVFKTILVKSLKEHDIYSREFARDVRKVIGTSKFAFMQDGELRLFGQFIKHGGCYYSNVRHLCTPAFYWRAS